MGEGLCDPRCNLLSHAWDVRGLFFPHCIIHADGMPSRDSCMRVVSSLGCLWLPAALGDACVCLAACGSGGGTIVRPPFTMPGMVQSKAGPLSWGRGYVWVLHEGLGQQAGHWYVADFRPDPLRRKHAGIGLSPDLIPISVQATV